MHAPTSWTSVAPLFPGVTLLIPHIPGIMTDYFAGRRVGRPGDLHCQGLPTDAPRAEAEACRVRRGRAVSGWHWWVG